MTMSLAREVGSRGITVNAVAPGFIKTAMTDVLPDDIKEKYKPMASYLGKTFFTNKTTFDRNHANYINITFGIQATDNGSGATRCFNWVSVGYFDEFVEYRKKGTFLCQHKRSTGKCAHCTTMIPFNHSRLFYTILT